MEGQKGLGVAGVGGLAYRTERMRVYKKLVVARAGVSASVVVVITVLGSMGRELIKLLLQVWMVC